jgi:predicted metal-binding protein
MSRRLASCPGIVGCPAAANSRNPQNERQNALRMGSGEKGARCSRVPGRIHRCTLRTGGVHDRAEIIHSLLERR